MKQGSLTKEEVKVVDESSWPYNENIDIPSDIAKLTVYGLPGERHGFGLRFEGGMASSAENVRHLCIQSCAMDSPWIRAKTSWDQLNERDENDEIIEIESVPVNPNGLYSNS
jgi:hypothetical protein